MLSMRLFFLMMLLVSACGGGGGGSGAASTSAGGTVPPVGTASGQLAFKVEGEVDPETVTGYVVGYPTQLKVEQAGDTYYIDNVPPGEHDVVLTAGTLAIGSGLTAASDRGVRLANQSFLAGVKTDLTKVEIPVAGSLSGVVTLKDQSDHAGIEVYIPGTTYIAKTDAQGKYSFTSVPVGVHNLYMEYQGFYRGQVENIEVTSAKNTIVSDMLLLVDTGVDGGILIEGGRSVSNDLTVSINLWAEGSKPTLMKISESESFTGTSWKPIKTTTSYTFTSQGPKTLYVMFSDANGLESSPYSDSITVDLFSDETQLFKPSFNVASATVYAPSTQFNLTGITIPSHATKMLVSLTGSLADAVEATPATSYAVSVPQTASSCGTKEILIAFKDEEGFVSTVSDKSNVTYTCWASTPTYDDGFAGNFDSPDLSFVGGTSYYIAVYQAGLGAMMRYNIASNTWSTVAYNSGGTNVMNRSIVWTGDNSSPQTSDRALAFGGSYLTAGTNPTSVNTAEIYNPQTNTWSALSVSSGSAPSERQDHAATFCDGKMFIWGGAYYDGAGGWTADAYLNTGGVYDLATQTWSAVTTTGALSGRSNPRAFCDSANDRVVVFGGYDGSSWKTDGAYYDLNNNSWTAFSSNYPHSGINSSDRVFFHNAVLMVWGNDTTSNVGAYWNGSSWTTVTTTGAPTAKSGMGVGFNGEKLIVWSGDAGGSTASNEGKYFDIATGKWASMPAGGKTSAQMQLVDWTGDRFMVAAQVPSSNMEFWQYFPFD